jgi:hypothetical protein
MVMMAMTTTSTTKPYPAAASRKFAGVPHASVSVFDAAEDTDKAAELMAAQTMRTRARTMTGFQEENELIRIAVHPVPR